MTEDAHHEMGIFISPLRTGPALLRHADNSQPVTKVPNTD